MTEQGNTDQGQSGRPAGGDALPEARRSATRWPGWVWLIPLGAVLLVGWFVYQGWIIGSHEVLVRFAHAEGVSRGTPVIYKGVQVGRVDSVGLRENLEGVELHLVLNDPLGSRLGEQTMFWIERPRIETGDVRGLIAGAHVAVRPAEGPPEEVFRGLDAPPPPRPDEPGRSILLTAADAGGLSRGSPVLFRGLEVGRVIDLRLTESKRRVRIRALVGEEHAALVREGSVFWRAGGPSVSMRGGFDIDLPPLPALVSGAVAFETPEFFAGAPVEDGTTFELHPGRDSAEAAAKGTRFAYFVRFAGTVSGISRGTPVELDGARIGRVAHVGLEVDAEQAGFATPMRIDIDARALGVDLEPADTREEARARLDDALGALVRSGLRAKISSGGFLPGGTSVTLVTVEGAEAASLDRQHEPPVIPAVSGDSE